METIALLTLASGMLALLCLFVLHFVSPEYQASWRMISEYAMGKHKWLISSFFYLWGISSALLSVFLWNVTSSGWAMLGIVLLVISAIGEVMGGLFDVKHKLHGLAFLLGVPALPIAALLLGYHLSQLENWQEHATILLIISHATWISLVLMAVAMAVMMSGFKKAGIVMDQHAEAPEQVPEGVIALAGYANRLLVLVYVLWLLVVAFLGLTH